MNQRGRRRKGGLSEKWASIRRKGGGRIGKTNTCADSRTAFDTNQTVGKIAQGIHSCAQVD